MLHKAFFQAMAPHLKEITWRTDALGGHAAWLTQINRLDASIKNLREPTGKAFDKMSLALARRTHEDAKKLLGITPSIGQTGHIVAMSRDANIALVENAGRDYAGAVRNIFTDPTSFGMRVEDLADRLQTAGLASESRAQLIARDQTLKLNAGLNEARQTAAGIEEYYWSTSHDASVRPTHAALDTSRQRWDSPPDIDGEPLNPGEDFQCRCVAVPILPSDDT